MNDVLPDHTQPNAARLSISGLKNFARALRGRMGRARWLARMVSKSSGLRFFLSAPGSEVAVRIKPISRDVFLRRGSSDLACFEQVFLNREYASPYPMNPEVIIDAGANVGAASLFFTAEYPNAKVFAIEPEPANFRQLQRNCLGLTNVTCINAALWPRDEDLSVANPDDESWAFSMTVPEPNRPRVAGISIPSLMRKYRIEHVDILKLDIEGSENELFSSGAGAWLDSVDTIVIEFHDRLKPGCARAFYSAIQGRDFAQEIRGENIFVRLLHSDRAAAALRHVG